MNDDATKQALEHLAKQGLLAVGKDGVVQLRQPKQYVWQPKKDIKPYELARAIEVMFMPILQQGDCDSAFEKLPDDAKRHFQVVER
ncbi:hypothetical protein [Sinorhizobium meliloti]|uniref:hypothetical protein n=1 Tax=Rhizobium meliloti TaxID=382 RepID=UPI000FDC3EDB|nr:hypothetical protein [Sinorhizobium meliloti]MDX0213839.1 hypothetical protein [Sinorhizobium meliloti]RVM22562.1 hypothetical protein CN132_25740 [Sinorhizobium meliloti]